MDTDVTALVSIAGMMLAGAAGYGGASTRLKQTERDIEELKEDLDEHEVTLSTHKTDTTDRLARIETKIDVLMERV